ncbi:MAG: 2-amino-4-hydroxy-6-hydroxymethyldihydropteridine diphosphokinase, partial [Acidobacteriaceae bacterium]|nr:2-amino-4-hydroxy-6-hydroxymethyldihydropteridine diphosphokinase [Acidobacteriaceae bacterium]
LGDREENLRRAADSLVTAGIHILKRSSIYETEPRDVTDQPWFLNAAVECETSLFPMQLLRATQRVERAGGRTKEGRRAKGPREIDIDILLYGSTIISTPELSIPHPRMLERRFVLDPLVEIAPDLKLPNSPLALREHLKRLQGQITQLVKPF